MKKADVFWQTYLNLENDLLEASKYILFTDYYRKVDTKTKVEKEIDYSHQLEVFSPFLADLLVRCCVEIESVSKELYFENGGTKTRGSNDVYFDQDCLAFLIQKWGIDKKKVIISSSLFDFKQESNSVLIPLKNAGKRSEAYWAKCYQAVKHDRYNCLYLGNVKAILEAMAALYLLNIYNRDIKLSTKYLSHKNIDLSFGSRVFSVCYPLETNVLDVINGQPVKTPLVSGECPYILKYTDSCYKDVKKACEEAVEARKDYFNKQPELQDKEFQQKLFDLMQKEKNDLSFKFDLLIELHKYRINKKLPNHIPFNERKRLLINTEEWNCSIRRNNNHLKVDELTEENIQREIDLAGTLMAFEVENRFEAKRFSKGINDGNCEMVIDKGNIKYPDD